MSSFCQDVKGNPMVGCHPAILDVQRQARRVARYPLPVLITGETGTGKELLAREIHSGSVRPDAQFVVVDGGTLVREIAGSELFGHVRGAFTGAFASRSGLVAEAEGGTLFLDEVGELDGDLQRHLLRLIQEGEYRPLGESRMRKADVRVVAATNRDLKAMVQEGKFREDLFYRLAVIHLHMPPLRERRSDIPLLAEHFSEQHLGEGMDRRPLTSDAQMALEQYHWPGNVRELSHAIAQALVYSESEQINADDLPSPILASARCDERDLYCLPYKEARQCSLEQFNREYVHRALLRTRGNVSLAARDSGIGRQYFQLRMVEQGILADSYRHPDK